LAQAFWLHTLLCRSGSAVQFSVFAVMAAIGKCTVIMCAMLGVAAGVKKDEYDFVIVGGGLAGTVLANRLSESGTHSVLLLNVAGAPPKAYSSPVIVSDEFIMKSNMTASEGLEVRINQPGYKPVPKFSTTETGSSPARWLGGSTLVQLTLYLRDHPELLDTWSAEGGDWNWEKLRQYFHRAENGASRADSKEWLSAGSGTPDYGNKGPWHIAKDPAYVHPLTEQFLKAAEAAGFPRLGDLNTQQGKGVAITPVSQHSDGTKMNSYDAYMLPAMDRPNLVVQHESRADRLIVQDGICTGVAYRHLGYRTDHVVKAKREVILSSGYIYTPRLLFLSGIGSQQELEAVGLPVVQNLPAVGKNLTAARFTPMAWHTREPSLSQMMGSPISPSHSKAVPESFQSAVLEGTARFRSSVAKRENPRAERPDVVMHFMPLYYAPKSAPIQYSLQGESWPLTTNAYTLLVTLGETEAKGSVSFQSGAPDVSPVVTHDPLTARDKEVAAEAVRLARKVGGSSQFAQPTQFVENNAGDADMFTAVYDGRGTCRMGNDQLTSVVNFNLEVHGVERLRIVDGSVIPQGSPYLAVPEVLALTERAADLILHKHAHELHGALAEHTTGHESSHQRKQTGPAATVPLSALIASFGSHTTLTQAVSHLKFINSAPGLAETAEETERPSVAIIAGCCLGVIMLTAFVKVLVTSFSKKVNGPGSESLLA